MEKKKIRFNAVDFIIVIALLAIAAALTVRYFTTTNGSLNLSKDGEIGVKLEVEVKVSGIQEKSRNYFALGDRISDEDGERFGKITKLNILPAEGYYIMETGEVKKLNIPTKIDAYITFECVGKIDRKGFLMSNGDYVAVSQQISLFTPKIDVYGSVISIDYEEINDEAYKEFSAELKENPDNVFKSALPISQEVYPTLNKENFSEEFEEAGNLSNIVENGKDADINSDGNVDNVNNADNAGDADN